MKTLVTALAVIISITNASAACMAGRTVCMAREQKLIEAAGTCKDETHQRGYKQLSPAYLHCMAEAKQEILYLEHQEDEQDIRDSEQQMIQDEQQDEIDALQNRIDETESEQ